MRRLPILAVASLLGMTGALLGAGAAYAASSKVTFSGGCGLLGVGAHSQPDTANLTVPAMSSVRFVNGLPVRSDLVLPGGKRYTLRPDSFLDLQIASGPAEALMEPACGSGMLPSYKKVTIEVEADHTDPVPPRTDSSPLSAPAAPAPPAPSGNASRSGAVGSSRFSSPGTSPAAGGTRQSSVPTAGQLAAGSSSANEPVVEPVAAGQVPGRASSLLAIVAAVCVIGVSAAAARAIAAQRAVRVAAT